MWTSGEGKEDNYVCMAYVSAEMRGAGLGVFLGVAYVSQMKMEIC